MNIVLIALSLLLILLYAILKQVIQKFPRPVALLTLGDQILFANRAFRKAHASPIFSHQTNFHLFGKWLQIATYETHKSDPQGEFLASVCHELKTPLTIIKGFSEMMQSLQNPSSSILGSAMKKIYHASLRMEKTIQNLTILEEIEHLVSKKKLTCNLLHLVETVQSQLLLIYPNAHIEIDMQLDRDFTLEAHPGLLEVALSNLIGNALKYSKEDDLYAKISIHLDPSISHDLDEDNLSIQIEDRGIGIAQEELPNIFDRFYRSYDPNAQKRKGSGLGLAIAKKIIEAHGGYIDAESELGVGTKFLLTLPVSCPMVALPS